MGVKFAYPEGGGTIKFGGPAITSSAGESNPSHYSTQGCGGLQEVIDLDERNSITTNVGGQDRGNIYASGRRHVGMLTHVLEEQTIYKLVPHGFWGNGGTKGYNDWADFGNTDPASPNYGGYTRASLLNPGLPLWANVGGTWAAISNGEVSAFGSDVAAMLASLQKWQDLVDEVTDETRALCWVKLELGGDTSPYVNGVNSLPGHWNSINQTGETIGDAPAVFGNKTFINSRLHIKHDSTASVSDPEDDAAVQVDKKVTIGTATEEIFSVKNNIINLHTITNAKNIPQVTAAEQNVWEHDAPLAGDEITIGSTDHTFQNGDLYTFVNAEGYTVLGIVA